MTLQEPVYGSAFCVTAREKIFTVFAAAAVVGDGKNYLKAGMNVDLLFDGTEVLDVRIQAHVELEVIHTEPGMKGNTATGATKPATVETDYTVQVPLFVNIGDVLKIDTRSGAYIERVRSN